MLLAVFTGPLTPRNFFLALCLVLSLTLWLWSFMTLLHLKSYNLFPKLKQKAQLVTQGPYYLIRHPIYTAMLLMALGFLVNDFSWWRIVIFLFLLVVTILKLKLEEKFLIKRFGKDYLNYQKKTKCLIPFVY